MVLSREEIAQIEVGHTTVSPMLARALVAVFLVLITIPGIIDLVADLRSGGDPTAWSTLVALPNQVRSTLAENASSGNAGFISQVRAGNRTVLTALHAFEDDLADDSPVFARFRPPAQTVLSEWLGVGNERVYQGRDGWLFYRPDVEYVMGRGFLDPAEMRRRRESDREWIEQPQPDPRQALVAFHRQLQQRGITLIVVPTPVKPEMHPEKLHRDPAVGVPVQNASFQAFVDDLRREHVAVFDVAEALARGGTASTTAYLATDTHWRPEAMERAAELLGAFVRDQVTLPALSGDPHRLDEQQITNVGDTAAMLDLPPGHRLNQPELVTIHRVVDTEGGAWKPSRDADVLVLGDSFSNIYSLASLGWGDSAGLVEHLGRILERPIDRIVQNDDGAFATRARLRQDLASGSDRLAGKRVVILQFAARELAAGDWKRIDLPAPGAP